MTPHEDPSIEPLDAVLSILENQSLYDCLRILAFSLAAVAQNIDDENPLEIVVGAVKAAYLLQLEASETLQ